MKPTAVVALTLAILPLHAQTGFTVNAGLVYATVPTSTGPVNLELDLYLPHGVAGPLPCVIWIHGGGWRNGSRSNPLCRFLTDYGYAVASIDYRLSGQASWPAQLHDCKGAVRWLRANATTYGLDPRRFGAWGASAGGHLAAMLGVTADIGEFRLGGYQLDLEGNSGGNGGESSRLQAVVDWYGPSDFLAMASFPSTVDHDAADSPESELIGGPIREHSVAVATADPATYLSRDDAPMLLRHGTWDPLVPFQQSEWLFEQGRGGFGLDWRFVSVRAGNHGGPGFGGDVELQFFDEQLAGNRPLVSLQALGPDPLEAPAQASNSVFRIMRSGALGAALDVVLQAGGTAAEGTDYRLLGSVVRIPAGSASIDLALVPIDDALVEGPETVRLSACPAAGYRVDPAANMAELAIIDDDSPSGLVAVSAVVVDGRADENGDPGQIALVRNGSHADSLTINYRMRGKARNGIDYAMVSGWATIPAGAAAMAVTFAPMADGKIESTEPIVLEIEPTNRYTIAGGSAHVQLFDADPGQLPLVTVVLGDASCAEHADDGSFLLSRTTGLGQPLTVRLAVSGSARGDMDFVAIPSSVTLSPGELVKDVIVTPVDDTETEGDETVVLTVLPDSSYRVGFCDRRTVVIEDDEAPVPADADCRLASGPMRLGQQWVLTLLDDGVGQPWAVFASAFAAYVPLPGVRYPLLLDPGSLQVVMTGSLGVGGRSSFGVGVPDQPDLVGVRFVCQAATLRMAPLELSLSERLSRIISR